MEEPVNLDWTVSNSGKVSNSTQVYNSLKESESVSHSVVSHSLRPHGLQHARLPCPSLSTGVCSNSCPLSGWCHPTISFQNVLKWSEVKIAQSCPTLCDLMDCMEFSIQNTGVGRLSLLQGIFPTQGSNPGLLHCRRILYRLSHLKVADYFY